MISFFAVILVLILKPNCSTCFSVVQMSSSSNVMCRESLASEVSLIGANHPLTIALDSSTVPPLKESFDCFDVVDVYVKGGSGGMGSMAQKFGRGRQHIYPFGGNGGNGGSVMLVVDPNLNTLQKFRQQSSFRAESGCKGDGNFRNGANGKDLIVYVPIGTSVLDVETSAALGTLWSEKQQLVVAPGGMGGRGNGAKGAKGEKLLASSPQGGQKRWLRLELQLLADVGLIGAPNAGKSTLLAALTNAKPKIGDYPFTTLVPNLGICYVKQFIPSFALDKALVLADIPGLIEGANYGKGLGLGFLRHIEKCSSLVHVVDISQDNAAEVYQIVNAELVSFSTLLASKPQIVVLNKADRIADNMELKERVERIMKRISHSRVIVMSAAQRISYRAIEGTVEEYSPFIDMGEFVSKLFYFVSKVAGSNKEILLNKVSLFSSNK